MKRFCYVLALMNINGVLARKLPPLAPYLEKLPPCSVASAQTADDYLNCVMNVEESYQSCDNDPSRCACDSFFIIQSQCLNNCSYSPQEQETLQTQVADLCQVVAADIESRQFDYQPDPPSRGPLPTIATHSLASRDLYVNSNSSSNSSGMTTTLTRSSSVVTTTVTLESSSLVVSADDDYDDCIPETATATDEEHTTTASATTDIAPPTSLTLASSIQTTPTPSPPVVVSDEPVPVDPTGPSSNPPLKAPTPHPILDTVSSTPTPSGDTNSEMTEGAGGAHFLDLIEDKLRQSERTPTEYPLNDNTDYDDRVKIPEDENGGTSYYELEEGDEDDDDFDSYLENEDENVDDYGEEDIDDYGEEEDYDDYEGILEYSEEDANNGDEELHGYVQDEYDPDCNEEEKKEKDFQDQIEEEYDPDCNEEEKGREMQEEQAEEYDTDCNEEEKEREMQEELAEEYDPDCNEEEKERERQEEQVEEYDPDCDGEDEEDMNIQTAWPTHTHSTSIVLSDIFVSSTSSTPHRIPTDPLSSELVPGPTPTEKEHEQKQIDSDITESSPSAESQSLTIMPTHANSSPSSNNITAPSKTANEHGPHHSNMKGINDIALEVDPTTVTRTITKQKNTATKKYIQLYLISNSAILMMLMLIL